MDVTALNREINCTGYGINSSKSYMKLVHECLTRIEFASSLLEQEVLTEEQYRNLVGKHKVEIKDALASVYTYLHLEDTKGHFDHVFTWDSEEGKENE